MGRVNYQEELKGILEKQKDILEEYAKVIDTFAEDDLVQVNEALKEQFEQMSRHCESYKQKVKLLVEENRKLKAHIGADLLEKRMQMVKDLSSRLTAYIEMTGDTNLSQIRVLEQNIIQELGRLGSETKQQLEEDEAIIYKALEEVKVLLEDKVRCQKEKVKEQISQQQQEVGEVMQRVTNEPIKPKLLIPEQRVESVSYKPQAQKNPKQNIELKIGLNWINKIGIGLILIGVIIGMRYTYIHLFTPTLKGILGALLGCLFLGGGIYFYGKEKKVFATGLTGGGIAIYYITIFVSYFMLDLISMPVAIVLSVGVSILSFILCHVFNSQTVGVFALIGGYLPVVTYGVLLGEVSSLSMMFIVGYVLLLNLVVLMLSLKKNWPFIGYISFVFNIPATLWCTAMLAYSWETTVYIVLNFIMYLGIAFAQPFVYKTKLGVGQVIVTALNTMISSVLLCVVFSFNGMGEQLGFVCAGFSVVYLGLELLTKKYLPEEEGMRLVFYITSVTFAVLMIPFQFNGVWIVMGWIIQGVLFVFFGRNRKQPIIEVSGIGLILLSTVTYYFVESWVPAEVWWKYGILIAALMTVLVIYLKAMASGELEERWDICVIGSEYFVWLNVVVYLQYNIKELYKYATGNSGIELLAIGIALLCIAICISKVELFRKSLAKYTVVLLYGMVALIGPIASLNAYSDTYLLDGSSRANTVMTMIYHLIVMLAVFVLIRQIKMIKSKFAQVAVIVGILFVIVDLQLFIIWGWPYDQVLAQVVMSIVCAVIAWSLIVIGFKQRYKFYRYCGLGLVTYAFGKLFLYDIVQIGSGYSIISFFGFGIVLLGISYVYQKFSKTIEDEEKEI